MLVMTFVTKSLSSVPAGVVRIAAVGIKPITSFAKAVMHRREIMFLSELDDRCLKDMGLLRSDVEGALATSWLRDPSAVLASRAGSAAHVAAERREEAVHRAGPASRELAPTDAINPFARAA